MKRVVKFQAHDGSLHDSQREAARYTEVAYTNEVCKIAAQIVKLDFKYQAVKEYIDANLKNFTKLAELKDAIQLEDEVEDA